LKEGRGQKAGGRRRKLGRGLNLSPILSALKGGACTQLRVKLEHNIAGNSQNHGLLLSETSLKCNTPKGIIFGIRNIA